MFPEIKSLSSNTQFQNNQGTLNGGLVKREMAYFQPTDDTNPADTSKIYEGEFENLDPTEDQDLQLGEFDAVNGNNDGGNSQIAFEYNGWGDNVDTYFDKLKNEPEVEQPQTQFEIQVNSIQ